MTSLSQVTNINPHPIMINTEQNSHQQSVETENEEVLMQEIISPFRKLFSGTQSSIGFKAESLN